MKTIATKRHRRLIELLIEERNSRQIGQAGLAYALRKGQAWISKIERGGRRVDVIEFLDLAAAIGFDPYEALAIIQGVAPERPLRPAKRAKRRGRKR